MSNIVVKTCPSCGSIEKPFVYKESIEKESFIYLRGCGSFLVEESGEQDTRASVPPVLNALAEKRPDLKLTIEQILGEMEKITEPLGPIEPKFIERTEIDFADFVHAIGENLDCDSGLIPWGCTYHKKLSSKNGLTPNIYIITKPPTTLTFKHKSSRENQVLTYNLSVPFLHMAFLVNNDKNKFTVQHDKVYLFLTPDYLSDIEQPIYWFPSGNQNANGVFCWHNAFPNNVNNHPLHRYLTNIFNTTFQSVWNNDLMRADLEIPKELSSYKKWEELTNKNPFYTFGNKEISWRKYYYPNLKALVDFLSTS